MSILIKKADKEKRIIEAATKLFAEKGYRSTTIEEIAREAGIAKGTVYLYFKDKQELFHHIVQRISETHEKNQIKIHEFKEWKDRLRQYIVLQLKFFQDNIYLARISIKETYGFDEEVARIFFKAIDRHVQLIASIIRGGMRDGVFREVDAHKTAMAFMGMVNYYIVYEFMENREQKLEETADFLLNLFLQGLENAKLRGQAQ